MRTKLLVLALLAGGSMFAQTRFSIGIGVGGYGQAYRQAAPYGYVRPPCPGPDYNWVDGYWSQDWGREAWIPGYWTRQVAPRYDNRYYGNRYYDAYGRQDFHRGFDHDRNRRFDRDWDRDGDRDHDRGYGRDHGRGYGYGFR